MEYVKNIVFVVALMGSVFAYGMQQVTFQKCEAPKNLKNFSWIDDHKKVAGMAYPSSAKVLEDLEKLNIGLVITLTEDPVLFVSKSIKFVHIPVIDFSVPTFEQVDQLIKAIDEVLKQGKSAVIHCMGGLGRTGTMLACWLVFKSGLDPKQAIKYVREKRPHSIETQQQEKFVSDFYKHLKG